MLSWLISKIPGFGGPSERDPASDAVLHGRRTSNELQSIQQDLAKDQAATDAGNAAGTSDGGSTGMSFGDLGAGGTFFDAGG